MPGAGEDWLEIWNSIPLDATAQTDQQVGARTTFASLQWKARVAFERANDLPLYQETVAAIRGDELQTKAANPATLPTPTLPTFHYKTSAADTDGDAGVWEDLTGNSGMFQSSGAS